MTSPASASPSAASSRTKATPSKRWKAGRPVFRPCPAPASNWCCWISGCPGIDGLDVLSHIQEVPFAERPVVVVISGHGTIETAVKATKLGAFDFLEKPLSISKVSVVVKNALAHRTLAIENSRLKADTGARYRIIGESVPDEGAAPAAFPHGGHQRPRHGLRRERHGQGTGRPCHPCHEPARGRAVRRSQLRRHPRRAHRKRDVRPQQRQLSPAPCRTRSANFRRPTAEPSSWTKSAI